MHKNLVIVESPAKAKTIGKFLGKDFVVKSSYGHIRDLKKSGMSINLDNNYEPIYEIPDDKKELVDDLIKEAKDAEIVWLASDEDREGEAIAWHLFNVLKLKKENTRRIVFHEITKTAILHAIENPRDIDDNLVSAQQARRVLDRIVGFELSPVLWKKVRPSLSAGRVQSKLRQRIFIQNTSHLHCRRQQRKGINAKGGTSTENQDRGGSKSILGKMQERRVQSFRHQCEANQERSSRSFHHFYTTAGGST